MSEKRFSLIEAIYDNIEKRSIEILDNLDKQVLEKKKIADLLNQLSDENEQLRKTVKQQLLRIHCQDQEIQKLMQEGKKE